MEKFDATKHIAPKRVFLQHDHDEGFPCFTWCDHKIHDDDLEYLPRDYVMELVKGLESIANNSCCDPCQEARKVAQGFLTNFKQKYG